MSWITFDEIKGDSYDNSINSRDTSVMCVCNNADSVDRRGKMNNKSMASNKYNKENTTQILIRLNKNTDADIIDILDKVGSKQGYIKGLIRADIILGKICR